MTFLNIVKVSLDIAGKFMGDRGAKASPAKATEALRVDLARQVSPALAERVRGPQEVQRGLSVLSQALTDWQISSTPLCPVVLRKTLSFGMEEKNLGLLPGTENPSHIERAYAEWRKWIEKGPRNNAGLLVFVLEAPRRETLQLIRGLNQQSSSWYHVVQAGCLDVRSGVFHGPPPGMLDHYLASFGVDTFWNSVMDGLNGVINLD